MLNEPKEYIRTKLDNELDYIFIKARQLRDQAHLNHLRELELKTAEEGLIKRYGAETVAKFGLNFDSLREAYAKSDALWAVKEAEELEAALKQ